MPTFVSIGGNPVQYFIPITITNSNTSLPPTAPYQQMITINSNNYSSYLASNLQNVNFQDGNGNIIPSWLESGNSNTSTNTIYWVNLANGLPSSGSTTIYYCIYSPSVNCIDGVNTGLAPQLTSTYGQYDNGSNVFPNYWNFAGTSLPSNLTVVGTITASVNNGLTLKTGETKTGTGFVVTNGLIRTSSTIITAPNSNPTAAIDALITTSISSTYPMVIIGLSGSTTVVSSSWLDYGIAWTYYNNKWNSISVAGSTSIAASYSDNVVSGTVYGTGQFYSYGSIQYINYNRYGPGITGQASYAYLGIYGNAGGQSYSVQWLRIRSFDYLINSSLGLLSNYPINISTSTSLSTARSSNLTFANQNGNPVLYYLGINISNYSSSPTSLPYTTQITINTSNYSSYLTSDLSNTNFQDGNGNILQSTIVSGGTNKSTTTIYSVTLPNGIPANSTITIYYCIYTTQSSYIAYPTLAEVTIQPFQPTINPSDTTNTKAQSFPSLKPFWYFKI